VKRIGRLLAVAFAVAVTAAEANVGLTGIAGTDGDGVVTVYYPSTDEAKLGRRGPFTVEFAWQGPESWTRRPVEVSRAIDVVSRDGLVTRLRGGFLDGAKTTIALWVIRSRFSDATWQAYTDPRIVAVVAGVPLAADFDMASRAAPRVPLALVTARQDKWLIPRFHSDAVLAVCAACERLADFATGGHGALLSPLPPGLSGLVGDLLNDPPGFDRAELPAVDRKISSFFRKLLLP
jgi:hypothetical protein